MSDEDALTPAQRELETALRSLRPTPARINPLAAALSAGRRAAPRRSQYWQIAAAAAAIAVVGGAWLTLRPHGQMSNRVERPAPVIDPELAAIELHLKPATLLAYRRALDKSPAELDALLDRQATTGVRPRNQFTPVGVLTLWNTDRHSSPGDM